MFVRTSSSLRPLLGAGALILFAVTATWATTVEEVARRLICQCGCGKVLAICEMEGWAIPAKELIARKAALGLSADAIVQYFVEQYGEKILAAPPKRGFFLTAWLTPFAGLLLGGIFLAVLVRRWARSGSARSSNPPPGPLTPQQHELADRFEAEVREGG